MAPPMQDGRGRGGGRGRGAGRGKGEGRGQGAPGRGRDFSEAARELAEIDGGAVEAESRIEILRAQRAAARGGKAAVQDAVRENEGIDEADPERVFDDGIRLEPFNMRREMAEGHFDEAGMYILNKQEEKEVTDAWLDTVDQAERTAIFKRNERQQKAAKTATSRISSLNKNLGKDEEEDEDEKEDKEEDDKDGAGQPAKDWPVAEQQAPDEPDDPATLLAFLEELIGMLLPLEKPAEALVRIARRESRRDEPLKLRARRRQARAEAEAGKESAQAQSGPGAGRRGKRKLNEFGDYEAHVPSKKAETVAAAAAAGLMAPQPAPEAASAAGADEGPAGAMDVADDAPAGTAGAAADAAAVAAAAEKAEAKDKAEKEAQAAFAAEQARVTRQTVNMAVDASAGVEAAANVTAEQPRIERPVEAVPVEVEPDVRPEDQPMKKRSSELGDAEKDRRKKIDRLTEVCDRLLERGVLVYDSTREALAIELRERKGDMILAEGGEQTGGESAVEQPAASSGSGGAEKSEGAPSSGTEAAAPAAPAAEAKAPSPPAASLIFSNKRIQSAAGEQGGGGLASLLAAADAASDGAPPRREADAAQAKGQRLLWQYRWSSSPEQLHGPFDSPTMHGWTMQNCFAPERPAEIRQCDEENAPMEQCWHKWDEIDFSLYL